MAEPASDELVAGIQWRNNDNLNCHQLVDWLDPRDLAALMSRIRKEQEDKAVMARALEPFANKIVAFEEAAARYGQDHAVVVPDGAQTYVTMGDLRRARAALTGSSTIISDMEAEIERLRKLLEPFAKEAECWDGYDDEEPVVEAFPSYCGRLTIGDLRRAAIKGPSNV